MSKKTHEYNNFIKTKSDILFNLFIDNKNSITREIATIEKLHHSTLITLSSGAIIYLFRDFNYYKVSVWCFLATVLLVLIAQFCSWLYFKKCEKINKYNYENNYNNIHSNNQISLPPFPKWDVVLKFLFGLPLITFIFGVLSFLNIQ
jgi:hypothetical protein